MSKETLKEQINADITTNGLQQITGAKLNNVLNDIVDEMALGGGVIEEGNTQAVSGGEVYDAINGITTITPINLSTPSPEQNGIFQPTEIGIYENFGGLSITEEELESNIVYFYYLDGVFSKQVKGVLTVDEVTPEGLNAVNGKAVFDYTNQTINTIADLRLFNGKEGQIITLLGYYEAGDKPPLNYKYTSTQGVDDGGSVINTDSGSWIAIFGDEVYLSDFGVKSTLVSGEYDAIIQSVFDKKYKIINFPLKGVVKIQNPINIESISGLTVKGNYCNLSYELGVDGIVFNITSDNVSSETRTRDINIQDFVTNNDVNSQIFINAVSSHHLHVSNCRTEGTKLFIKARDCYFMTVEKNYLFSIYQAFDFQSATNSFNIIGNSIYGAGIASYFQNNTTGGNISGNSFELSAGALEFGFGNFGVNITGNYFEGYNATDFYIKFDGGGTYQEVRGFNIAGNLFYAGALYAIYILAAKGISIKGNSFGTKHAIRQYCFDGVRNNDIDYSGNSWKSSVSGASEFNYYGAKKDGLIASDIKTMNRFMPTTNTDVENYENDNLLYNNNGVLSQKTINKEFIVGGQHRLLYKVTVANQVEDFNLNLSKLGYIAKVYVFSAAFNSLCDEYTVLRSVNNGNVIFIKPPATKEYPEINISKTVGGDSITFVDTLGGRFINVIISK